MVTLGYVVIVSLSLYIFCFIYSISLAPNLILVFRIWHSRIGIINSKRVHLFIVHKSSFFPHFFLSLPRSITFILCLSMALLPNQIVLIEYYAYCGLCIAHTLIGWNAFFFLLKEEEFAVKSLSESNCQHFALFICEIPFEARRSHRKAIRANKTHKSDFKLTSHYAIQLQIFFLFCAKRRQKSRGKNIDFAPLNRFHIIKFSFIISTKLNHNAI